MYFPDGVREPLMPLSGTIDLNEDSYENDDNCG